METYEMDLGCAMDPNHWNCDIVYMTEKNPMIKYMLFWTKRKLRKVGSHHLESFTQIWIM